MPESSGIESLQAQQSKISYTIPNGSCTDWSSCRKCGTNIPEYKPPRINLLLLLLLLLLYYFYSFYYLFSSSLIWTIGLIQIN